MFLTMNLDCTREDSNLLITLITTFSSRLFSSEDVLSMVQRDHTHEARLLYLRFLNILMSRKKDRGKEGKVGVVFVSHVMLPTCAYYVCYITLNHTHPHTHTQASYASHMLFYTTANCLLKDTPLLEISRQLLSEIIAHPQCLQVSEVCMTID